MVYTKDQVVAWIERQLAHPSMIERPCPDGLRDALVYLGPRGAPQRVTFSDGSPVMPAEPSERVLAAVNCTTLHDARVYYRRIRNALMRPPEPETKTVWCVAWYLNGQPYIRQYETEARAILKRDEALRQADTYTNVSPVWSQVVPVTEE